MNQIKLSIFKDLFETREVPYPVTLGKVVERIKNGASKETLIKIRNATDKEDRSKLKKKLPCIIFSGQFRERNKNGLIKHSGLMVFDFDGYADKQSLTKAIEELKQNKHFVLIFVSPSGNGIKGVIKVSDELDKDSHPRVFKQFQKDFNYENFDGVTSNIDRVCFESYDPNIYVNYNAEIYNPEIIDEGYSITEKVPLVPISDESVIIDKIMKFNFSKNFVEGERNAYIFDLAGLFCEYGISENTAFGYIYNNIVIGDFSEKETKNTIKSAYRMRQFNCKFFEDYKKIDAIKLDLKKGKDKVLKNHNITEDVYEEIKETQEHDDFWYISEDKKGNRKVKIIPLKYKLFLERNGFKKYYPNGASKPTWVYIESNKVRETSVEKIKDFVLNYLSDKREFEVWNYCSSFQNLFSDSFLLMLDTIELKMLKDEKYKSYIAFNNGILTVTKDEVKLIDYIEVDGYIWENQIIKRDFNVVEDYENEYQKFIYNISNGEPIAIEVVIGYLLSTYKNKMNNKAVILNDEVISDNPEGGTGKGLFVQGIKQIRNVSILDGKSFDDKKSFPYQTVKQETNVLVFDDVNKGFNFENKFSLVTEGLTLERKNKDAIKLKVEESPKLLISTNYAIQGEGNSHDRRRHELEFAQYYGKELTPYDEFGRQLFDDWSDEDFLKFDNYMVACLQSYLSMGLIEQNAKNLDLRKYISSTNMEFNEWISDTENFPLNVRHNKVEKYNQITSEYSDFKKFLSQKRFTVWVKKYANFKGYQYKEGKSNGNRWFEISNGEDIEINDYDEVPF